MTVTQAATASLLTAYADQLQEQDAIRTDAVARAFATVPRHLFINAIYNDGDRIMVGDEPSIEVLDRIYSDRSLMTHIPADEAGGYSSASQPSLAAKMIEALDLQPGMRILEIRCRHRLQRRPHRHHHRQPRHHAGCQRDGRPRGRPRARAGRYRPRRCDPQ